MTKGLLSRDEVRQAFGTRLDPKSRLLLDVRNDHAREVRHVLENSRISLIP